MRFIFSFFWKNRHIYYWVIALEILKIFFSSMTLMFNIVSTILLIFILLKGLIVMAIQTKQDIVGREIHITRSDGSISVGAN